jgi:hypothetical protein
MGREVLLLVHLLFSESFDVALGLGGDAANDLARFPGCSTTVCGIGGGDRLFVTEIFSCRYLVVRFRPVFDDEVAIVTGRTGCGRNAIELASLSRCGVAGLWRVRVLILWFCVSHG